MKSWSKLINKANANTYRAQFTVTKLIFVSFVTVTGKNVFFIAYRSRLFLFLKCKLFQILQFALSELNFANCKPL